MTEQSPTLEEEEKDLQKSRVHLLFGPSFVGCNTRKHGGVSRAVPAGLSVTGAVKTPVLSKVRAAALNDPLECLL